MTRLADLSLSIKEQSYQRSQPLETPYCTNASGYFTSCPRHDCWLKHATSLEKHVPRQGRAKMGVDPYANCDFNIAKDDCTVETCCLAQSYFLYRPDYSGNLFFVIFFLVCIFPQVALGIRFKTWGYMVGMFLGLVLEAIGYCSRIGLHQDPFSQGSFML